VKAIHADMVDGSCNGVRTGFTLVICHSLNVLIFTFYEQTIEKYM